MNKGMVLNIQRFCLNDGPGIRTTVFLKGCPLHCAWCHNPESQPQRSEMLFDRQKCIHCGRCMEVCPNQAHSLLKGVHIYERDKCKMCGACVTFCPTEALETAGREMTVEEVMKEVLKDKAYYDNTGGGITLSGGEPLMQFDFSLELLKTAKGNGLHTCIETCGFTSEDKIIKIAGGTDTFLYDWKVTDISQHKKFTGVTNENIESNLRILDRIGAQIILRCPIIPGVNDSEAHFNGIAQLAEELKNIQHIEVEPYHDMGKYKFEKLGRPESVQSFLVVEQEKVEEWIAVIKSKTHIPVTRG